MWGTKLPTHLKCCLHSAVQYKSTNIFKRRPHGGDVISNDRNIEIAHFLKVLGFVGDHFLVSSS